MKARSALLIVCLVAVGLETIVTPAQATFHLMKVREVYAGSLIDPNADFLELQMYSAGQNQVINHKFQVYDASGGYQECVIPSSVTNPENQATILFATTQAQSALGTTADFTMPAIISGSGGAACWENIDCVSWGSFSGATTSPAGTPEPGGISAGQSIDRRIDISGSPTALEDADDTNDSANDFESEAPSPKPNGPVNLGSVTCTAGGGATDTTAPSSKITSPKHNTTVKTKNSRKFRGTASDEGGSGVSTVELALREKLKGGCKWWNGAAFVKGACGEKAFRIRPRLFLEGNRAWSYTLPDELKPTGDKIKSYTLYSRATDGAGNVETDFEAGRNVSSYQVGDNILSRQPRPMES